MLIRRCKLSASVTKTVLRGFDQTYIVLNVRPISTDIYSETCYRVSVCFKLLKIVCWEELFDSVFYNTHVSDEVLTLVENTALQLFFPRIVIIYVPNDSTFALTDSIVLDSLLDIFPQIYRHIDRVNGPEDLW